ncbi:MAG TPA: lysylphosphatidylglycerol synthase transmembrane domain-containing protein, partial [Ilumatobacteraceae bacterium]
QRLRRITVGSVIRVVLPAIAVIALISGIAGLDIEEVADALRDASWWIILFGLVFTQVPRVTQSFSTIGASPVPLPLGPVYALQLAVSYINLAIPSSAARIAVNIRFFQRHGVPPGTAMAAGALDGVTGFVVQATLLVSILLLTPATLGVDLDSASPSGITRVLLLVIAIAVVAIAVVFVVRPWREFVVKWVKRLTAEAMVAVRGLKSPRRLGMLIGGNVATEVLFAMSLGIFVRAFGFSMSLTDLLLVNISVALLAGLLPIPGGIGVAEGGLTYGLVRAGMPEEIAFAAVICYRMASFYLPPIWGFFAMRWLERNRHL